MVDQRSVRTWIPEGETETEFFSAQPPEQDHTGGRKEQGMRPDIRQRIARAEADREAREKAEHARIRRAVFLRELTEENRQFKEDMRYNLFLLADAYVSVLEAARDALKPKQGEEWSENFCKVIELLPEARRFAVECWFDCVEEK